MPVDAATLAEGATLASDVCVVGAGAAGITLARALRDSGLRIVLLESGGMELEGRTQALYDGETSGVTTLLLDEHRWRYFGGSTNRWNGWCMPLADYDFEARPYIPGSGWPITLAELEPYYARAHQRVELGDYAWDFEDIRARSGAPALVFASGRLRNRLYQFSPPTRFGRTYLQDLEAASDIEVYLHANVTGIVLDDDDHVSHLEARVLGGPSFRVEASAFVLATGGIEVPRLLLANDVANQSGLVGRYFMEHPHYYNSCVLVLRSPRDLMIYGRQAVTMPSSGSSRPVEIKAVLGLSPDELARHELPDFTMELRQAAVGPGETGELDAATIRQLLRGRFGTSSLYVTIRAEPTPNYDSRVSLVPGELDELGMPRVHVHWAIAAEDRSALRRALEVIGAEVAASGLGRLWTPVEDGRFDWSTFPGGHHMGTTRMSADPAGGVVDANLRCHDVENLYIASSAVFPTAGAANPTLTIVALAERLADHLQAELT